MRYAPPRFLPVLWCGFMLLASLSLLGCNDSIDNSVPPVADAGPDQTVDVGSTVFLDGLGSSDADSSFLLFDWVMVAKPAGSITALNNATSTNPSFVPDVAGIYSIQLIVSDGDFTSEPSVVTITAR